MEVSDPFHPDSHLYCGSFLLVGSLMIISMDWSGSSYDTLARADKLRAFIPIGPVEDTLDV